MKVSTTVTFVCLLIVLTATIISAMNAPQGAPINIRDVTTLQRVGSPSVADNFAAYTVRNYDINKKQVTTTIDVLSLSTSETYTMVKEDGKSFYSPAAAPGGKPYVAYTDGSQIYLLDVSKTTKTTLTSFPEGIDGIDNIKWSPCGRFLVFSMKSWLSCGNDLNCQAQKNQAESKATWRTYNQLYLRHWSSWETEGKYNRIFVLPLTVSEGKVATVKTISGTDAVYDIFPTDLVVATPVPPFGGAEEYDIAPDGNAIAVTGEVIQHDTAWRTDWKVYYVTIQWNGQTPTLGTPLCVSKDNVARTQDPRFFDANTLYYLSMDRPKSESDRLHLVQYEINTQHKTHLLKDGFDRSIGEYFFVGRIAYLSVGEDGEQAIYAFDLDKQDPQRIWSTGHPGGFSVINGTLYLSYNDWKQPSNIYRGDLTKNGLALDLTRITHYNVNTLSRFQMSDPQKFYFMSEGNVRVQGWIMEPVNYQPGKKYPVAHLIHGGPEGAWASGWSYRWNPQLFTAAGYVVVMINPRGSTGFGQAFTDAVLQNWGGVPYQDLMNGMDFVLQNFDMVDTNNVVAAGASYGGYMINWLNGHTDRYNCLVNHDGVFSTVDMFYQTDELFFSENEYGGLPWEARDLYEKWNPERFVENWKTPTLVIEGYQDFRVPWSQALSTFTTLQRKGIESKFVIYPSENHWVLNSANSIHWYDTVLDWFAKHIQ